MRITQKLPLVIVSLCLASSAVVGLAAYLKSSRQLLDAAQSQLLALAESRKIQVETLLSTYDQDVEGLSANQAVVQALTAFTDGIHALGLKGTPPGPYLKESYADKNPNPPGKRHLLDQAAEASDWGMAHVQYHPTFRKLIETRGMSDFMLVGSTGRIAYTAGKRADFLGDLRSDAMKSTAPARVFEALIKSPVRGRVIATDFAPYPPTGASTAFLGIALLDIVDDLQGVLIASVELDGINRILAAASGLGRTGEVLLVGTDSELRNTPRFGLKTYSRIDNPAVSAGLRGETGVVSLTSNEGSEMLAVHAPIVLGDLKWAMVIQAELDEILAPVRETRTFQFVSSILILAIAAMIGIAFARRIGKPICGMTRAMSRLAAGDTSVEIPAMEGNDEVSEMSRAVQVFKTSAIEMVELRSAQEEARRKAEQEQRQMTLRLADEFESGMAEVVGNVGTASADMEATAQTMSSLASQVAAQANAVAVASDHAAANVQTVAAATEQLSASVSEIGRQVAQSAKVSRDAVAEAEATDTIVRGLADAAGCIGEVVSLINDIAGQTNLLALNATIEAARAGEAGKGFAVVAGEVKTLASQTAKATDEIARQVAAVQAETDRAAAALRDVSGTIRRIDEISSAIASAVEEQTAATDEIARNVEEAARGTQEVSANISGVTHATAETGRAAGTVLDAARRLSGESSRLQGAVAQFVGRIRVG